MGNSEHEHGFPISVEVNFFSADPGGKLDLHIEDITGLEQRLIDIEERITDMEEEIDDIMEGTVKNWAYADILVTSAAVSGANAINIPLDGVIQSGKPVAGNSITIPKNGTYTASLRASVLINTSSKTVGLALLKNGTVVTEITEKSPSSSSTSFLLAIFEYPINCETGDVITLQMRNAGDTSNFTMNSAKGHLFLKLL